MTNRWTRLFRRPDDGALDAELRDHLERLTTAFRQQGLSETEARRRALLQLGGVDQIKDDCRDLRGAAWLRQTGRDLRFFLGHARRQPLFWIIIVATLVLGTATSAAIFAIVDGVLLRALPYPDADRLVSVSRLNYKGEFLHLQQHARTLTAGAYTAVQPVSLTGRGEPVRLQASRVNGALFDVLQTAPLAGRRFVSDDTLRGAVPVAIVSHDLWMRRFGGDPSLVESSLTIDGLSYTVVGIMPPTFRYPAGAELWLPLAIDAADRIGLWSTNARTIGRLDPGRSVAEARSELRAMMPAIRAQFPWRMPPTYGQTANVVPLRTEIVGDVRVPLLSLLGSVLVVLLIVCVNVANLLLALGFSREREFAIRAAVGATRARLIRQLLIESGAVALCAGVLGTLAATALVKGARPFLPPDLPRLDEIVVDARVLAFALISSIACGLLFGILPALRATFAVLDLAPLRTSAGTSLRASERRVGRLLAVAEFALASLLVVTAALLARNLLNLLAVNPGFHPEQVIAATVAPLRSRYATPAMRRQFAGDIIGRLRQTPEVTAAAAGTIVPFAPGLFGTVFRMEGLPEPAATGDWPGAEVSGAISPDYMRVLSVPVLEGRMFSDADGIDAPRVAVVSRALARRYWPGASPVGTRIRFPAPNAPWITIVGVVGDMKWRTLGDEQTDFGPVSMGGWLGALYLPLAQSDVDVVRTIARSNGGATTLSANLRGLFAAVDPEAPVSDIRPLAGQVAASAARPRFTATVLSFFAGVALLLSAIGVYGVLAYAVRRRRQEFAVRMAVGGPRRAILRGVIVEGMTLTIVGIALGLAGSFATVRTATQLFSELTASDVGVVAAVAAVLAGVGLLASYLPARRATLISPAETLRG